MGDKVISQLPDPVPGHPILLAPSSERAPPKVGDVVTERAECTTVRRQPRVSEFLVRVLEAGDLAVRINRRRCGFGIRAAFAGKLRSKLPDAGFEWLRRFRPTGSALRLRWPPACGRTLAAHVLAHVLGLSLITCEQVCLGKQ